MPPENGTETLEASIAGQKVKLATKHINDLLTLLIAIAMGVLLWVMWSHQQDAKEAGQAFVQSIKEQTNVMKEQTTVAREQNCLLRIKPELRDRDPEFCRNISK